MNLFLIVLTIIYDQLYILMPIGATLKCSDLVTGPLLVEKILKISIELISVCLFPRVVSV